MTTLLTVLGHVGETFNYNTTTTSSGSSSLTAPIFIVGGILGIVSIVGLWRVFQKAGRPGWAAIIPFYNTWTLLEIGGQKGWYALLAFIPFVGIIVIVPLILAMLEIAKRFGKSAVFAIVGLLLFSPIGFLILGFDKSTYNNGEQNTFGGGSFGPQQPNELAGYNNQPANQFSGPQVVQPGQQVVTPPSPGPSDNQTPPTNSQV